MKLLDILLESGDKKRKEEIIYNALLEFFKKQKKNGGPRFAHTYEIWKEYRGFIISEIIRATMWENEGKLTEADYDYTPSNIEIVYTEKEGDFYKTYIYKTNLDSDHTTLDRIKSTEEYLKAVTGLSITLPRKYDEKILELIKKKLKKKGIKFGYGDYMDID